MSNIFSTNPIYVNLYDPNSKLYKRIYLIGDVPRDIKKEFQIIEKNFPNVPKNLPAIKKWYGKDYIKLLDLDSGAVGGDDTSSELPLDLFADIEDVFEPKPEQKTAQAESEINFEELLDPNNDSVKERLVLTLENNVADDLISAVQVKSKFNNVKFQDLEFVYNVTIYPQDTITDLKTKIAIATKIPLFRQHLFSESKTNIQPIYYNLTVSNIRANNDIRSTKNIETIMGIPINKIYYENKDKLRVIAMDDFTNVDTFFELVKSNELFLVDLFSYISNNRNEIYKKVKSDQYYKDMIYYGFIILYYPMLSVNSFLKFLEMGNEFVNIYTDYKININSLQKMYDLQNIITNYYDELTFNEPSSIKLNIEKYLTFSITTANLNIQRLSFEQDTVIYARNIFDLYETDRYVDLIKAYIKYDNNQQVLLTKKFNTSKEPDDIIEKMFFNSLIMRIWMPKFRYPLYLVIFHTGNYTVKTKWSEELNYTFDDIIKSCKLYVNPIIERINGMGNKALFHNRQLNLIGKHNSRFTNVTCSTIWHQSLTTAQFDLMKEQADDFRKAKIFKSKYTDVSKLEYYFTKISNSYDVTRLLKLLQVNNLYDYLSDSVVKTKYETLFQKSHILSIEHRLPNVKIEITGIKDNEYETFQKYIISFFGLYLSACKKTNCNTDFQEILDRKTKAPIKALKSRDPELYNFTSNRKNTYSRLCQKPFQPLLFDMEEYKDLKPGMKKASYTYWNFTKRTPAIYVCPNPKYPNLRFIVGKHPKNYCIPCCKIKEQDENNEHTKKIIDTCKKTYSYGEGKKLIVSKNPYVMAYGKDIEVDRLSQLPKESLEPIFYDIFTGTDMKYGMDPECTTGTGYFLYGVAQNTEHITNVGVAFILVKILNQIENIAKLNEDILDRIKKNPNLFKFLLQGKIIEFCLNIDQLKDILYTRDMETIDIFPWNDFYMSVAFLCYNINIILFEDAGDHVDLVLPRAINDVNEYFIDGYRNLLLFKKQLKYYPIFYINTTIYYVNGVIDNKLFSNKTDLIARLAAIIKSKITSVDRDINLVSQEFSYLSLYFNLFAVKSFCDSKFKESGDEIVEYYINKNNLCYCLKLVNGIYLPIVESYTSDFNKSKFDLPGHCELVDLLKFRRRYNDHVIARSKDAGMVKQKNYDPKIPEMQVEPIIPFIEIEKWLTIKDKVYGFICNDLHFYIKPCHIDFAMKHYKTQEKIELLYDPNLVNATLLKHQLNEAPNISNELYTYYLYQLFVLEFVKHLSMLRNNRLREKIKKLIATSNIGGDFVEFRQQITKLIKNDDDQTKILYQINTFINLNKEKSDILQEIDNSVYKFDSDVLEHMKTLNKAKVVGILKSMSKKYVDISKNRNILDINNIISSCKAEHCKSSKLLMTKSEYDSYIDTLASEIVNPLKNDWVFSDIYLAKNIDLNRYIYNPTETITISLYDV